LKASSVSIKTRNDRIKDIKEATDPRLIHPDGQNVPRLNRKGNIMSMSSTSDGLTSFRGSTRSTPRLKMRGVAGTAMAQLVEIRMLSAPVVMGRRGTSILFRSVRMAKRASTEVSGTAIAS